MKRLITTLVTLLFTLSTIAQIDQLDDKSIKGTIEYTIEENNPKDNTQLIKSKRKPLPPIKAEYKKLDSQPFSMFDQDELMDAGEELQKKWDIRDKKILNKYQKDQYLGTFGIKGTFFSIECRDHEYVDGDRVQIYVNGVLVEANMKLISRFKGINADLIIGKNVIEFIALNQGSSGPNTAQFRVLNDKGEIITSQEWNLLTGVKASLVVFKE